MQSEIVTGLEDTQLKCIQTLSLVWRTLIFNSIRHWHLFMGHSASMQLEIDTGLEDIQLQHAARLKGTVTVQSNALRRKEAVGS